MLYFSCNFSSAFYLSLTFFALLRKIAWWPSAGKDTKCMRFKCNVKNLRHVEAGLMHFCHGKMRFFYVKPPVVVVVVLVFYGPSTHFRLFRAQSVSLSTLFLGKPPRQFTST